MKEIFNDFSSSFIRNCSVTLIMSIFVFICMKKRLESKNEDGSFKLKYSKNLFYGLLFILIIFLVFVLFFLGVLIESKDMELIIPISICVVFDIILLIIMYLLKRREIFIKNDVICVKPIIGRPFNFTFNDIINVIYYRLGGVKIVLTNGKKIKFDRRLITNVDYFDEELKKHNVKINYW